MALRRQLVACALTAIVSLSFASTADSQLRPVLSVSNGIGWGSGGLYDNRQRFSLDGYLGARKTNGSHALILSAYGGVTFGLSDEGSISICSTDRCYHIPEFPTYDYLGVAFGGEIRKRYVGLSLIGGPGAFRRDSEGSAVEVTKVGGLVKGDVNFFVGEHFQWVVSGTSRRVVDQYERTLFIHAAGIGIRVVP